MLFTIQGSFRGFIEDRQVQPGIKDPTTMLDAAILKVRLRSFIDAPHSGASLGWESYFYDTYRIVCPD